MIKVANILRAISWGKYQTTFYFRGKPFFSSPWGGLLTILFTLSILAFSVFTLSSIFNYEHYNLKTSTFGIQGYELFENLTFSNDLKECDRPECRVITIRDQLE